MPKVFLSPSLQEFNSYVNGGNEEYFMNLVADAMEPYLRASGIEFERNTPSQTLSQAIAQSNRSGADLHFAIHSNAAGAANAGKVRGTDFYYYPTSTNGNRAADIFVENYKEIYPLPDRVKKVSTTSLAEIRNTSAPAILVETAYHDNVQDADFIKDNIDNIARNLSRSIAQYFDVPFKEP